MQQVQWYPGHMFKTLKDIQKMVKLVDVTLIILDARIPISSFNFDLVKKTDNKPQIILFNKSKLVDPKYLEKFHKYYQSKGYLTLNIDALSGYNLNKIEPLLKKAMLNKISRDKEKGKQITQIKTIVLGIPNCGKSTLINMLSKDKSCAVANMPGFTKSIKLIRVSKEFILYDTPGILWPKFENDIGLNLACCKAIKESILPLHEVAIHLIDILVKNSKIALEKRYDINIINQNSYEILEQIGKKRNLLVKNGETDDLRAMQLLLKDYRQGLLGGIVLDEFPN